MKPQLLQGEEPGSNPGISCHTESSFCMEKGAKSEPSNRDKGRLAEGSAGAQEGGLQEEMKLTEQLIQQSLWKFGNVYSGGGLAMN